HDLAAPLQGLRTVADSAQHPAADPTLTRPLRDQLAHLDLLIDQLRVYLQSRTMSLRISPVDVAPICAAALRAAEGRADANGVNLRLAFDVDVTTVAGEVTAIRRILDNLLVNAIAASPAGADVVLRVHAEDRRTITLSVTDNGMGLSPAQQAQIFEP